MAGEHDGLLLGYYEVLRELGRSGRGTVYLARDRRLMKVCALEVVPGPSFPAHVVGLARSIQEGDDGLYPVLADALADRGEDEAAVPCREDPRLEGRRVVDW